MADSSSRAKEALREALFIALMCQCGRCGAINCLEDIDHLADTDTEAWATQAVRRVLPLGWTASHTSDDLLCPACCRRSNLG